MKRILFTIFGMLAITSIASATVVACYKDIRDCYAASDAQEAQTGHRIECVQDPNPTQCTTDLTLKYQKQEMEKAGYAKSLIEPITDINLLPSDPAFNYATASVAIGGIPPAHHSFWQKVWDFILSLFK